MAKGNERRVRPGTKLSIPAATWNLVIDMVKNFKREKFTVGVPESTLAISPNNTIRLNNNTSYDAFAFEVFEITDIIGDPEADAFAVKRRPAFQGDMPIAADRPIAIVQAPVYQGEMATAVIGGITPAFVKMNDPTHTWANPVPNEKGYLESVDCGGQARILWHAPVSGSGADNPSIPNVATSGSGSDRDQYEIAVVNLIGAVACAAGGGEDAGFWAQPGSGDGSLGTITTTYAALTNALEFFSAGFYELYYNYRISAPNMGTNTRIYARLVETSSSGSELYPSETAITVGENVATYHESRSWKMLYEFNAPGFIQAQIKTTVTGFPAGPFFTHACIGYKKIEGT